jgi:hypothetical protein
MNPLTQVKNTQKITARESALGVSDAGSWHAKYRDSAYVYAGNFSFDLTEGDLLAVFAQLRSSPLPPFSRLLPNRARTNCGGGPPLLICFSPLAAGMARSWT